MTPDTKFNPGETPKQPVKATDKIKAWAPIITAIIALVGTIAVAYFQSNSAKGSDLKEIVKHTNNVVLPKLEDTIVSLRERVAKLEVMNEVLQSSIRVLHKRISKIPRPDPNIVVGPMSVASDFDEKPVLDKPTAYKAPIAAKKEFRIPRLQVQQMAQ